MLDLNKIRTYNTIKRKTSNFDSIKKPVFQHLFYPTEKYKDWLFPNRNNKNTTPRVDWRFNLQEYRTYILFSS